MKTIFKLAFLTLLFNPFIPAKSQITLENNKIRLVTDGTPAVNTALTNFFNDNNGDSLCRAKPDGSLYTATNEDRNVAFLCRGNDFGKTFFQQVAVELLKRGVTHINDDADHMISLGGPCFNRSHGHPVPYGTREKDVINNVFREIIQEAKNRHIGDFS